MKLVFQKDELVFATQAVQNMVNAQSSLPILSNILIHPVESKVQLVASDLESSVKCGVAAEISDPSDITVPASTFASLVRELPDAPVTLELKDDTVTVSCESLKYELATRDPIDFPAWPQFEPKTTIEVQQKTLRRAIERVMFAIPQRDPRKVLLGALFDIDDLNLKCVATDGKKLGYVELELDDRTGEKKIDSIMPQKILNEIQRTLKDEGTVKIMIGDRQVAFDLGAIQYVSNKLDGAYPNYNRVIPQSFEQSMRISKNRLMSAIRQAAIIADEKNHSVKFHFKDNALNLSAMTYDVGSFAGSIPLDNDVEDFEIVFNHRFVMEVLRLVEKDEIELKVNKPASPAVFIGADETDSLFVIMPIKITDLADDAAAEE